VDEQADAARAARRLLADGLPPGRPGVPVLPRHANGFGSRPLPEAKPVQGSG
jgi:hypothetical protein